MAPMAEEYAGRGVQFLFVYVREAHPGEHYPHHDSFERKLAHARAFQRMCQNSVHDGFADLILPTHGASERLVQAQSPTGYRTITLNLHP